MKKFLHYLIDRPIGKIYKYSSSSAIIRLERFPHKSLLFYSILCPNITVRYCMLEEERIVFLLIEPLSLTDQVSRQGNELCYSNSRPCYTGCIYLFFFLERLRDIIVYDI